jgi:drug/metabolite transporter (DMT)-like permease
MLTGILAGLGAGAFWGMTFIAPLMVSGFSSVDVTVGRFVACGVFALLLMVARPLSQRWRTHRPSASSARNLHTPQQVLA